MEFKCGPDTQGKFVTAAGSNLTHFGSRVVFSIAVLAPVAPGRYHGSMHDAFDLLVPVSLLAVLAVLGVGIFALFRGGDFGRSWSNKLMRLRVLMQFIAIIVLMSAIWWRRGFH